MSGRRPKKGLDFIGWEVGVLDNDGKIDRLIESQGIAAFTVYFYLCQHAYATQGYYLDWSYSQCATTARKLGRGASAEFVKNVVDMCFQCGLFEKRLFEECGILTSRGIQRRYWNAIRDRVGKYEAKQFWLLTSEECQGFDLVTQKTDFPPRNALHKRREEERILQESESTGNTENAVGGFIPPTPEQLHGYCEKQGLRIDEEHFLDYHRQNGWVMANGLPVKDWRARVRAWAKREQKYREPEETSEYEELVAGYLPRYTKREEEKECR